MEYSIQEIARAAGVTSRTLRHYDGIGLVTPSRVGDNGYRYYDDRSLVRLQRVLLLRELGLGLDAIGQVLAAQDAQAAGTAGDPAAAEARILTAHLDLLRQERGRIEMQIGSVERTIAALRRAHSGGTSHTAEGEDLMSEKMFEGFDHTRYREEVEQRWGADAYAKSDRWWRGLGEEGQAEWRSRMERLGLDWIEAARRGVDPESPEAQGLARRHVEWLRGIPGTPAWEETRSVSSPEFVRPLPQPAWEETRSVSSPEFVRPLPQPAAEGGDLAGYVRGLAEMYVADERFAANYGGVEGATFVRDALVAYVERELGA
ncbi:MerR family transcriptional regulator [Leucobacter sp.]